jgi:hypothetical protein
LCDGSAPTCPQNAVLPEGTPCEDEGFCELGFCNTPEPPEEDTGSEGDTEEGDIIDPDPGDAMDGEGSMDGSGMDTWNPEEEDTKETEGDSGGEDAASEEDSETSLSEDTAVETDGVTNLPQGDALLMDGAATDSLGSLKNDTRARGNAPGNDAIQEGSQGDAVIDGHGASLVSSEDEGCAQTTPWGSPLFLLLLPLLLLARHPYSV